MSKLKADSLIFSENIKKNVTEWNKTVETQCYDSGLFDMPLVYNSLAK